MVVDLKKICPEFWGAIPTTPAWRPTETMLSKWANAGSPRGARMRKFIWGFIIGLLAFPILCAAYLVSGRAPVAVTDRPFPFEQYVAGAARESRIHRVAPERNIASFTAADLMAGAQAYRRGCGCHGLP